MTAKEYYLTLEKCNTGEEFQTQINQILKSFVWEISTLMEIRKTNKHDGISAIIKELNLKWKSFIKIVSKSDINTHEVELTPELFHDAVIKDNPSAKKYIDSRIKNEKPKAPPVYNAPIIPYIVTPFNEIIKANINREILCCLTAVSQYFRGGLTLTYIAPLVNRITFLRYWAKNGINYDEIPLYEEDSEKFIKDKCASII